MRRTRIVLLIGAVVAAIGIPVALASASSAPTVQTTGVGSITTDGARVTGSLNPNGEPTSFAFQWGPTAGYGHETPLGRTGSGSATLNEVATISTAQAGKTYHVRIIAINASGTSVGQDKTFTTTGDPLPPSPVPAVATGSSTNVSQNGATVSGTVSPSGQATTYYFEYGPTSNYGFESSAQQAGSGTTAAPVSANLSGLTPGTAYHYRVVAFNAGGTTLGSDQTFTTQNAPTTSHVAFLGREGFVSPGRVIGVEAGCFGGETFCSGNVTLSHDGVVFGQRKFNIAPNSGGFENMKITKQGMAAVKRNRVFHLIGVTVSITTSTGQHISQTMHLARWVWH